MLYAQKYVLRTGCKSMASLVTAMNKSVNDNIAKLKQVQAWLTDFYRSAKQFDREVKTLEE
jgi:hypothetical protein